MAVLPADRGLTSRGYKKDSGIGHGGSREWLPYVVSSRFRGWILFFVGLYLLRAFRSGRDPPGHTGWEGDGCGHPSLVSGCERGGMEIERLDDQHSRASAQRGAVFVWGTTTRSRLVGRGRPRSLLGDRGCSISAVDRGRRDTHGDSFADDVRRQRCARRDPESPEAWVGQAA